MRVWLVDDAPTDAPGGLGALLGELAARAETGISLLAVRAGWSDFAVELRAQRPEVLVVRDTPWLDGPWTEDVLNLGPALLIVGCPEGCARFGALAEQHPVSFVPLRTSAEGLLLALMGALAGQRRQAQLKAQAARLQQRLDDRIIIERAKGVLVQRLGVSEEDAYKRLRVLSRRQRRQIRDIAQSLLDTQSLLVPDANGFLDHPEPPERPHKDKLSAPLGTEGHVL
jgi:ANTAR domain-containing protein